MIVSRHLEAFEQVIKSVTEDQVIKIGTSSGNLDKTEKYFKNLGVQSVRRVHRRYPKANRKILGLQITGPDYDNEGRITSVFIPYPTSLTISNKNQEEEKGLGVLLADAVIGLQEIVIGVVKEISQENMSEEEQKILKKQEAKDLLKTHNYKFDLPNFSDVRRIKPGIFHKKNETGKLLQKVKVKNQGFLSSDDEIVSIRYRVNDSFDGFHTKDAVHSFFDMLITEIYDTPTGYLIGFYDLEPTSNIRKRNLIEAMGGKSVDISAYEHKYFFVRDLVEVQNFPLMKYGQRKFLKKELSDLPIQSKAVKINKASKLHAANLEILKKVVAKNPDFLSAEDKVVNIQYGDVIERNPLVKSMGGAIERSLLITRVKEIDDTVLIFYKDLKNYKRKSQRTKSLIEFLINGHVAVPPQENQICIFSLDGIRVLDPYDYAVAVLLETKMEGVKNIRTEFETAPILIADNVASDLRSFVKLGEYLDNTVPIFVIGMGNTTLTDVIITGIKETDDGAIFSYYTLTDITGDSEKLALFLAIGEKVPAPKGPTRKFLESSVTSVIKRYPKEYALEKFLGNEKGN